MTSILKADRVQSTSDGFVLPPAGGVIQTQYTQFTGTNTVSGSAGADLVVSDLTVNITPISTSSIIRIDAMVNGCLLYTSPSPRD